MTHADGPDPDPALTERNHTQHELNTPLTVILGRAQLLTRAVQRSSALPELERGALLEGLAAIEAAARALTTQVADLGHADPDGRIRDDAAIGATEPDGPP
jgi:hypothetical protein